MIELLGKENVKVNKDQMSNIMKMLRKEELIEQNDKEEKKKEKEEKLQEKLQEKELLKDNATDLTPGGQAETRDTKEEEEARKQ